MLSAFPSWTEALMNDKQDGDVGSSESDIDTVTVNTLPESAIARLRAEADGVLGVDPYSTADSGIHKTAPRRTLHDMRRLSEKIKRRRVYK
jgi:hypothetical protein